MSRRFTRRRFLAAVVGTSAALAGCTDATAGPRADDDQSGETEPTDERTSSTRSTTRVRTTPATSRTETTAGETTAGGTTAGGTTAATTDTRTERTSATAVPKERDHELRYGTDIDHPVTEELGREPTIGDYPSETQATVVEFQDISCTVCADFDARTFPRLYSNLIQTGDLTFVSRDFPHVKPWTYRATMALDATYFRNADAYWSLKSRYYAHIGEYTKENVLSKTHTFLDTETAVDADAVVRDVENEAFADALARDDRIKENVGVDVTPTFFLFRDGEFVTRLKGHQNYTVFQKTLGL